MKYRGPQVTLVTKTGGEDRRPEMRRVNHGDSSTYSGRDEVYRQFLQWPQYVAYKSERGEEFKDPRRVTFLETRCPCLLKSRHPHRVFSVVRFGYALNVDPNTFLFSSLR